MMKSSLGLVLTVMLSGWGVVWLAACGSSDEPAGQPPPSDAATPDPFGSSACGQCVHAACEAPLDACAADPECGAWLDCLDQCATTSSGDAEPSCEGACPAPGGASGSGARDSVQACRASGPGAQCASCVGAADAGADSADAAPANPILQQVCPPSQETQACWKCEDEHCCDTYQTCKANAECEAFTQCMKACTASMEDCTGQCAAQHEAGYDDYLRRMACVEVLCPVACGENTDPCWACGVEKCGDPLATCLADRNCDLYMSCSSACSDDVCVADCSSAWPGGETLFLVYEDCLVVKCVSFCGEL